MPAFTLSGPVPGSAAAATGLQPQTLDAGVSVQIATALAAASGNANTTPQGPAFTVQPRGDRGDRTINFSAQGIGAIPTTVTANLLASYDGGATWQTIAVGLALCAAGV